MNQNETHEPLIQPQVLNDGPVTRKDLIIALNDFSEKLWIRLDKKFESIDRKFEKLEEKLTNLELRFGKLENKQWFILVILGTISSYIGWKFIL